MIKKMPETEISPEDQKRYEEAERLAEQLHSNEAEQEIKDALFGRNGSTETALTVATNQFGTEK